MTERLVQAAKLGGGGVRKGIAARNGRPGLLMLLLATSNIAALFPCIGHTFPSGSALHV